MLFAAVLLPLGFLSAQNPRISIPYEVHRQRAIQINELAGHIDSLNDAHTLVNLVAAEFSDELPPGWMTHSLGNRIAQAEYESATEPGALIPEQRIADAWNDYLERVGAPQAYLVTPAELHALRDSQYVSSQLFWARGSQSIWSMRNICAVGPDGKVAGG